MADSFNDSTYIWLLIKFLVSAGQGVKIELIKDNVDRLLGLVVWACALVIPIDRFFDDPKFLTPINWWAYCYPFIWLGLTCLIVVRRQRPVEKLTWVWISGPVTAYAWFFMAWP